LIYPWPVELKLTARFKRLLVLVVQTQCVAKLMDYKATPEVLDIYVVHVEMERRLIPCRPDRLARSAINT